MDLQREMCIRDRDIDLRPGFIIIIGVCVWGGREREREKEFLLVVITSSLGYYPDHLMMDKCVISLCLTSV